jgi:hypothetical protein
MSFKRIQLKSKEELLELIRENIAVIQKESDVLGGPFGTEEFPLIDLVARKKNGRPLLIFADIQPDEAAMFHAAAQKDWFVKNRTLLLQLFPDLKMDQSAPPRAALIYPEFPLLMKRFIGAALPSQSPLLYQYRCFEALGHKYLDLERVTADKPKQSEHPAGVPLFRRGVFSEEVEITPEEREAFLF